MSDFTILEITDTSVLSDEIAPESNKRRYTADEGETSSLKKFKDEEEKLYDDDDDDDDEQEHPEKDASEVTTNLNKSDESSYLHEIESIVDHSTEKMDSNDERYSDQEEEEEPDEQASESDDSSDNYDDDALMVRAMKASNNMQEHDEPIELDDSDSSINDELEHSEIKSSGANDTTQESNEAEDCIHEYSLRKRMLRYNPRFYLSRLLVKKSIRILKMKSVKQINADEMIPIVKNENHKNEDFVPMDVDESKENEKENVIAEKVDEKIPENDEPPFLSDETKIETSSKENDTANKMEHSKEEILNLVEEGEEEQQQEKASSEPVTAIEKIAISNDIKGYDKELAEDANSNSIDKIQATNCNNQKHEKEDCSSLLTEISKSTIDEMMNRYVFRTNASEHDISTEDFSEDLFICLQQNKQEIVKVQKEWNEKLHVKYKIREIMERIRRHRTVVEIEGFGFKPSQDNFNRIVSSKSSTTNSENDNFEKSSRMSSESVSRLIQDVRANVLKRDEKQRALDLSNIGDSTIYDENSSFSLSSHLQPNQGRQGQIIDVQSIINDFRQKNPQEVPRRGRRVKNSYTNNSVLSENRHIFTPFNRIEINARTSDQHINTSSKTNSGGFPEVSLLPVSNFYKNLSQSAGNSQIGQKSSLLQSILTKSTKNNFQHLNSSASTSTLARLLTAPERDRRSQNTSRSLHMNDARQSNGEITITPIAGTVRKHEFSMDDEDDDSNEAPLVIDEPEELDNSNRNKSAESLLCQGCRRNKALFMCAGCSKQWYCSKECQEVAWDNHAESCMV